MTEPDRWYTEHNREIAAAPEVVWSLLRDVAGWTAWNAGIEWIRLDGPFAPGTWFTMKPPGQEAVHSQLTDVRENQRFADETRLSGLVIRVDHRIEPLGDRRSRVIYALEARGPGAAEVGPAVSADFPQVLAALAARAAERAAAPDAVLKAAG